MNVSLRMHWWLVFGLLAVALAAVVASGCGGDDDDDAAPGETATPTTGATAPAGTSTVGAQTAYPVTVTDLLGRQVEIAFKPEAVVALSPTAAEFVYAAGGTLVGRASSVTYPERALQVQTVGTAYQPNFEAILALKPDLIVADSVIHAQPSLRQPLEDLGVPVIFAGAESYQDVLDGLDLLGAVFTSTQNTDAIIAAINKTRDDAKAKIGGRSVTAVVLISDRDQVLYAAKDNSYAGDLLQQLGITNPAANEPDAGPFPGYTALATEKLIQFNPDLVFTTTPAPPPAPRLGDLFVQIPPFKGLKAVVGEDVVELDVSIILQAPGPRVLVAMRALADAVAGTQ